MSERSAEAAHARMDTHEAVCALRYENLLTAIHGLKANDASLWNRIWLAVGAVVGTQTVIIGWALLKLFDR